MSLDFETDMRFARKELFRGGGPQLVVSPWREKAGAYTCPVRGMACAVIMVEVKAYEDNGKTKYEYWTTPECLHFTFVQHKAKPLQLRIQYPCWEFVNRGIENLVFHNLNCKTCDVTLVDSFIETKAANGLDEYVRVVLWFLTDADSAGGSLVQSPSKPPKHSSETTRTRSPKSTSPASRCCLWWHRARARAPPATDTSTENRKSTSKTPAVFDFRGSK